MGVRWDVPWGVISGMTLSIHVIPNVTRDVIFRMTLTFFSVLTQLLLRSKIVGVKEDLTGIRQGGDFLGGIGFNSIAEYLRHGREIEFTYQDRQYSITNHSGFWYLCDDTEHILLEEICRVEEKDILISKVADSMIDGLSIQQIFDRRVYDTKKIYVL